MKKLILFIVVLQFAFFNVSKAKGTIPPDEGMWLPLLIEKMNYNDMVKMGLKLTPEQLYSINNSSIKDAIVGLVNKKLPIHMFFCTGEIVSPQGLILTNHHCAYEAIQSLSSVEKDYLTNGFWAYRKEEELPLENLHVSFLVRIEDVTSKVLKDVTDQTSIEDRERLVEKQIKIIEKEATEKGKYEAYVKPFFEGGEYYLFVYQTYKDVRLVGAPPSSIGKFGGDTDNWMWPRHTGDFTYLRVYSAPDGSPADYSPTNIPLKPKHYLPISLKGIEKNDFTMIFGYPGTTDRYLTSMGVDFAVKNVNPLVVKIREKKLEIMNEFMKESDKTRIQYAAKYSQTANYWKYYKGQTMGLRLHNVYERRKKLEEDFVRWYSQNEERKQKYGDVLKDIEEAYKEFEPHIKPFYYLQEAVFQGPEFIYFSVGLYQLYGVLNNQNQAKSKKEKENLNPAIQAQVENFKLKVKDHFKNYNIDLDKKMFIEMLKMMYNDLDKSQLPDIFEKAMKKYKNNIELWANDIYKNSILVDEAKLNKFLAKPDFKTLEKDLGWEVTKSMVTHIRTLYVKYNAYDKKMRNATRLFIEAIRQMQPNKKFYSNANSTMRMTYGKVIDYYPADAVHYNYYTTHIGLIEKEDSLNEEFIVPKKLKDLIERRDFGIYGKNDTLHLCFITDNDITGGNSGSPVINAEGHLVGVAFDGNWESMSGDIQYEPSVKRTICADIRYVLFITDKFAGAKNLIEEMTIIR